MRLTAQCGEVLPPLRLASALPVSLQRLTELTPTLKISATSRRDAPLSTASTARTRKAVEYGLDIDLAPLGSSFPFPALHSNSNRLYRSKAVMNCVPARIWSLVPLGPESPQQEAGLRASF